MMSPSPERPETVADLAPIFSASQRISEQPCTERQGQTKLLARCLAFSVVHAWHLSAAPGQVT